MTVLPGSTTLLCVFRPTARNVLTSEENTKTVDERETGPTKRKRAERDCQIEGASVHRETSGRMPLTEFFAVILADSSFRVELS